MEKEEGNSPAEQSERTAAFFPWGRTTPPLAHGKPAGNYAGAEASDDLRNTCIGFRCVLEPPKP